MTDKERFEDILRRIRRGMSTSQDADTLKDMMHQAWSRNAERAKNVVKLSDRASFVQNGKKDP